MKCVPPKLTWDYWNFTLVYSVRRCCSQSHRAEESVYVPHNERAARLWFFNWVMSQSRGPVPVRNSTWAKPFSSLRKMQPVRKWINPTKQLLEFDQQYHSGGLHVTSGCSHHNKNEGKEDQVKHKRCVLGDQLGSPYSLSVIFTCSLSVEGYGQSLLPIWWAKHTL